MTHEPNGWYVRAKVSAASAIDIYERGSVEYELALYLGRALRECSRLVEALQDCQNTDDMHVYNTAKDAILRYRTNESVA